MNEEAMAGDKPSVDEQMRVLMRGVEYGDPHIQATMETELGERLAEDGPLRVYAGFDPTVRDLHLGYVVPMLKLRQFQRFGHDVTFLMGTFTATIGDPTDRTAARQMRTREEVEALAETWISQASRLLDPQKTAFKRNATWLASLDFEDIINMASHFTVQQFLERQGFRERLETAKPIYLHEFMYPLMQGYDAVELKTDVQIGGVDQLFNIMAGRELQRDFGQKPLIALTTPLLIGTDGHLKMSQSIGNYIAFDDAPADMYGKVMSIPDSLIVNYFTLLTDVPNEELHEIEKSIDRRPSNAMDAKKRLAHSIVALLNGQDAADQAQAEFERVFQRRENPEDSAVELPLQLDSAGKAQIDVTQALTQAGAAASRSEARRLLAQGAVAIDGEPVKVPNVEVREGSLIRVGRHRFLRVVRQS
jgi:tyrosyl-tRNA synthetase